MGVWRVRTERSPDWRISQICSAMSPAFSSSQTSMRIYRKDIEPQVCEKHMAQIAASSVMPNPISQEAVARQTWQKRVNAHLARTGKRSLGRIFGSIAAGFFGGLLVAGMGVPEWAWIPMAVDGPFGTTIGVATIVRDFALRRTRTASFSAYTRT
jgi:hypothetical protein